MPFLQLADTVDPNVIPTSMLQRIDIQADGGSAIYGADAVAGTVNLILRRPSDIIEMTGQSGFEKGGAINWLANGIIGHTWHGGGLLGDGGFIISVQRQYTDAVSASALSYAYTDNLSSYYPTGLQPTSSTPGNVRGFGATPAAQGVLYPVPASGIGSTQGLTLSQLGTGGSPNRTSSYTKAWDVVPQITRDSFAFNVTQDISSFAHFSAFGYYDQRTGQATYGSSPQLTSNLTVPNTNPYSPCFAGANQTNSQGLTCPASGTLTVPYDFVNEYGTSTQRLFHDQNWTEVANLNFDLPHHWTLNLSEDYGRAFSYATLNPQLNNTALNQVLSGVNKPSGVPFFNPFCSDVSGPCNSPSTLNYFTATSVGSNVNSELDLQANADGRLFHLPGGDVRLAIGFDYYHEGNTIHNYADNTSAIGLYVDSNNTTLRRHSIAGYGELYVPLVGPDNAFTGVQSLVVTAAVRGTHYTIPNLSSVNPKIGVDWYPVSDLRIHGSYGTSFRAPNLREVNPGAAAAMMGATLAPQVCSSYTGSGGACPNGASEPLTPLYFIGGRPQVQPEKATTYSVGFDWKPHWLPGLSASVNWYKIDYTNVLSQPAANAFPVAVVTSGLYDSEVIYNPSYFPTKAVVNDEVLLWLPGLTKGAALTQAQYNSIYPIIKASNVPAYSTAVDPTLSVPFIADGRFYNTGGIWTDGFDFSARYVFNTPIGPGHVGGVATYVRKFMVQQVTGTPILDEDNRFGWPVRFRGRAEIGIDRDDWNATLYVNYTNPYKSDPAYVPAAAVALNPNYLNISSNTTFDLSVGYATGNRPSMWLAKNIRFQAILTNMFDKKPPFFLNAAAAPAILFDPNQASPLGRIITLRLTKDW